MGADQGHGWRGLIKDAASGGFDVFFRLTRFDNGICWKIQGFLWSPKFLSVCWDKFKLNWFPHIWLIETMILEEY